MPCVVVPHDGLAAIVLPSQLPRYELCTAVYAMYCVISITHVALMSVSVFVIMVDRVSKDHEKARQKHGVEADGNNFADGCQHGLL